MGLVHAMPHDRNHEHNFPEQAQAATTRQLVSLSQKKKVSLFADEAGVQRL